MSGGGSSGPWAPEAARTLLLTGALGVGLLLVGWTGSSGTGVAAEQTAWVGAAGGGLLVLALGGGTWLLAGRSAVAARRARLLSASAALLPGGLAGARGADRARERSRTGRRDAGAVALTEPLLTEPLLTEPLLTEPLLAVPGTTRYHRPGCCLVAGKPAVPARASEHAAAGRAPCEVCAP